MKSVTDADLRSSIEESDKPLVIVDYWAPWCAPCVQVGKLLEFVEEFHSGVKVLKINIDENPQAATGKTSIPVLEVYSHGELVAQRVGGLNRRQLIQLVDEHTSSGVS